MDEVEEHREDPEELGAVGGPSGICENLEAGVLLGYPLPSVAAGRLLKIFPFYN